MSGQQQQGGQPQYGQSPYGQPQYSQPQRGQYHQRRPLDRQEHVRMCVVIVNVVLLMAFAAVAAACGYYAYKDGTKQPANRRSLLSAASIAGMAGFVSSAMCMVYAGQSTYKSGFSFIKAPWYVPLVPLLLAAVPAAVCADGYMQSRGTDPAKMIVKQQQAERDLAGFGVSLGMAAVALPWMATNAASWCKPKF
jgi:hypothetical protein